MFDSLYSQAKRLRFPKEIETHYRADYFVSTISSTRTALILGIVLYALSGFLDLYALPISRQSAWIIRYGIVVPLFTLTLAISYVDELHEIVQPATCFRAIMAGLGISYMIAITNEVEYGNRFYVTGILLISLWSYSLARLRFGYALLANLLIIAGYEYVANHVKQYLTTETGTEVFTLNNFFLSRTLPTS